MTVSVLDTNLNNVGSVVAMIESIGAEARVIQSAEEIINAEKLVLPGIGKFNSLVKNLNNYDLWNALGAYLETKRPYLGICLGMQILTSGSSEGAVQGFGLYQNSCVDLGSLTQKPVPHIGWNKVVPHKDTRLLKNLEQNKFYFMHSFAITDCDENYISSFTEYGTKFVSVFEDGNHFGTQFHPERSHVYGKQIFSNFMEII
jgi:imidazole glycerol-phosphate synthase subunit HisH